MADWKFNPENYNPSGYTLIPEGLYRVRIDEAEEKTSQSGKDMIKLTLSVSGYNMKVWKYIVLDSSNAEATRRTDQWLGSIYDSFGIERGTLDVYSWEGKIGGAKIRHRPDQNGDMRSEVHYFLPRKKVEELPAWREGTNGTSNDDVPDEFGASVTDVLF